MEDWEKHMGKERTWMGKRIDTQYERRAEEKQKLEPLKLQVKRNDLPYIQKHARKRIRNVH